MKIFLHIIFLLPTYLLAQTPMGDGFYLPIDEKDCGGKTLKFVNETFCLPEEPIFGLQVIGSISELNRVRKTVFFDLRIKREEALKLKKVIERLNQNNLVIVLDNQLVGLAKYEQLSDFSRLRFYSSKLRGKIDEIHAYLRGATKTMNGKREG